MQQSLTAEQLKQIETQVTEYGGSQYLELHIEFCDHLSTAIESAWASGSEESFEVLLVREIRKFGYAGLRILSQNKEKDIKQKYKKEAWQLFKSCWTWPKMLITLLLGVLFYGLFISIANMDLRIWLYAVLWFSGYFYIIPFFYKHFKALKRQAIKVLAMKMLTDPLIVWVIIFNLFTNVVTLGDLLEYHWGIALYVLVQLSLWIHTFYIVPLMFRESWQKAAQLTRIA